jgi:oxygen-independent coproporphyrinogen-3 oxidase
MSGDPCRLGLDRYEEILPKYATEGPRYTSYPTAPVWSEAYGPDDYLAELGRDDIDPRDPLSIYVHVPFCESLCHYCACNKVITRNHDLALDYLDTIEREVAAVAAAVRVPRRTTQHHWGGGTPTYLTPEQATRLFGCVNSAFPIADDAEVSIEVDPRVTTDEHIAALRECGFNRISMGVQDFEPKVQEAVHRIQPADETGRLVESARARGFESVNFDLIYGLPYQTPETFGRTLDTVLALAPDRIALYSYAHVTWVAKQQRGFERKDLPAAETKLAIMLLAIRRFLDAGYLFIGLDHFARPDDELSTALRDRTLRRNFMGHTTQAGADMVGFGPSAISELRGSYAQSQRELGDWHEAVATTGVATMRGHRLSSDDVRRRWVIGRIMCLGELRAKEFAHEFGGDFASEFTAELGALSPMVADGIVTIAGDGSLEITPIGRLFVRNVAMEFDAYLPEQLRSGKRMFSKTV